MTQLSHAFPNANILYHTASRPVLFLLGAHRLQDVAACSSPLYLLLPSYQTYLWCLSPIRVLAFLCLFSLLPFLALLSSAASRQLFQSMHFCKHKDTIANQLRQETSQFTIICSKSDPTLPRFPYCKHFISHLCHCSILIYYMFVRRCEAIFVESGRDLRGEYGRVRVSTRNQDRRLAKKGRRQRQINVRWLADYK